MIAFGSAISDSESYNRYARPGIELAAEADSPVFAFAAVGHISRTYNLMMDKAAELDGLEALVLAHPHAQITDPALCERVRHVFRDPDVAIAGPSGARDVQSIAWWDWEGQLGAGDPALHPPRRRRAARVRVGPAGPAGARGRGA